MGPLLQPLELRICLIVRCNDNTRLKNESSTMLYKQNAADNVGLIDIVVLTESI